MRSKLQVEQSITRNGETLAFRSVVLPFYRILPQVPFAQV